MSSDNSEDDCAMAATTQVALVAFRRAPPTSVVESLVGTQQVDDQGWHIVVCACPPRDVAHRLAELVDDETLGASGAILAAIPSPDQLWIAREWTGRLVVERTCLDALGEDLAGWARAGNYDPLDLVILKRPGPPDNVEQTTSAIPEVSTAADFCSAVTSGHPARFTISATELDARSTRVFGRLADPSVGGSVALSMIAPISPEDTEKRVLLTPAALGLRIGPPAAGLAELMQTTGLSVQAHGITYRPSEIAERFHSLNEALDPAAVEETVRRHTQRSGCEYAVIAVFHAPIDPTVTIAPGAVFEHHRPRNEQNLIVAQPVEALVPLGQFIPVIMPAWCMNETLSPPTGSPMRPTALSMVLPPATQTAVWSRISDAQRQAT